MKQIAEIKKLASQDVKAKEIKIKMDEMFGQQAFCIATVYKYINEERFHFDSSSERQKPGRKPDEMLIARINEILKDEPFSSVRSIAEELKENPSTIYRYLTSYIGLIFKYSRYVPHSLSDLQKLERVAQSLDLSKVIESCKHDSYRSILTGDQKWCILKYSSIGAWVLADENPPLFENNTIGTQKMMLTVIWNPNGFYVIDFCPRNTKYNSEYFINYILAKIVEKKNEIWKNSKKRKIWIHLDNSRVHNSNATSQKVAEFGLKRTPHPPFSPDIAPSDFFLFGYLTDKLRGQRFTSFEDLQERIIEIFNSIPHETLKNVFQTWIDRCNWVSMHEGEYFNKK